MLRAYRVVAAAAWPSERRGHLYVLTVAATTEPDAAVAARGELYRAGADYAVVWRVDPLPDVDNQVAAIVDVALALSRAPKRAAS